MAEALYRKYRPQVFEDVVGQEPIERTLKNAISQDKVSHAYLFCGPRGTGKTTTARLLAKALLCQKGPTPDPDGTCEDCWRIADGTHPDVYELDAASRTGVENVREEIISRVHFAPTRGRYKVYIIDEVHMLSTAAFNALLKTLEEPPSHVVFILCTTDPQKVPETIHSRCQRFDFHRISPESMVARLGAICVAENVEFEGEALDLIAQRADGGLRNALTSLEQIIAFENGKVTLAGAERLLGSISSNDLAEIMSYIGSRDIANCFKWTADYVETGADLAQFVRDMSEHVRNLFIMALVGDDAELEISETTRRELVAELAWFGSDRASRLLGVLGDLSAELKTTSNPRLAFEIALTRMVRPDSDLTLESLAERIEALESGYSSVAHVLPGAAAAAAPVAAATPASFRDVPATGDGHAVVESASDWNRQGSSTEPAAAAGSMDDTGTGAGAQPDAARSAQLQGELSAAASSEQVQAVQGFGSAGSAGPAEASGAFPQEAVRAADVPSKASSLANPAALQRIWQATLASVKKQKQAYGVLFMSTKAAFDAESGMLRVVFPEESTFAFNAVQKPDVQDALASALEKALGEPVKFCYVKGQGAPSSQGLGAQRADRQQLSSQSQAQLDGQLQRGKESQAHPEPLAQPEHQQDPQGLQAHPEPQAQPEQQQAPQGTRDIVESVPGAVGEEAPYEGPFYEEVPYEEAPYDPVPYEEFDGAQVSAPSPAPADGPDAATTASPSGPQLTPEGALREDPAELQAMLQASFGADVVLSETDE